MTQSTPRCTSVSTAWGGARKVKAFGTGAPRSEMQHSRLRRQRSAERVSSQISAALSPRTRRFEPEARIGAAFVCFLRGAHGPGQVGDPAWAARASDPRRPAVQGYAGAPYERGLLALREGALLETAVRALTKPPD